MIDWILSALNFISWDFEVNVLDAVGTVIAVVGAWLALVQWAKGNDYKRAEQVQALITKVRDDEDIAKIMDIIDWDKKIEYNGKFHAEGMDERELFIKVDKTLSHFSYICYLWKRKCLKDKDMYHFEYELRRIVDNPSMADYLHSLYHWSRSLKTKCSFEYLIDYSLKKGYLDRKQFSIVSEHGKYRQFLRLNSFYLEKHRR